MRKFHLALLVLAACGGGGKSDSGSTTGSCVDKGCSYGYYTATNTTGESPIRPPDETEPGDTAAPPCDDQADVTLYVSPDDSNSMSSPEQARDAVLQSGEVDAPLREWEFFDYYTFDYPAADAGQLSVTADLVAGEEAGEYLLQVGIASEHVDASERPPLNLTFVLDTSGSMAGGSLARLLEIGEVIAAQLQAGDVVSMVTWNTEQSAVLSGHVATGPNDPAILSAFHGLTADGGTDLAAGLQAGYQLADANRDSSRINRVILISDGGANVGVTDEDLIGRYAGGEDEDGIYLVGAGVGESGYAYNDLLMDTVTDVGKGASLFIGHDGEAQAMFGDRFLETIGVAARNVQISYDLPPGFEVVRFSGEEISTQASEVEPQHIAPNDAMVLHQTLRTCAPELVTDDSPLVVHVTWQDAITFAPEETTFETTFGALLAQDAPLLRKGTAVAAYVQALKDARDAGNGAVPSMGDALAAIAAARIDGPDADLNEMEAVLDAL